MAIRMIWPLHRACLLWPSLEGVLQKYPDYLESWSTPLSTCPAHLAVSCTANTQIEAMLLTFHDCIHAPRPHHLATSLHCAASLSRHPDAAVLNTAPKTNYLGLSRSAFGKRSASQALTTLDWTYCPGCSLSTHTPHNAGLP